MLGYTVLSLTCDLVAFTCAVLLKPQYGQWGWWDYTLTGVGVLACGAAVVFAVLVGLS